MLTPGTIPAHVAPRRCVWFLAAQPLWAFLLHWGTASAGVLPSTGAGGNFFLASLCDLGLPLGCPFGRGSLEKLGPHTQASFSLESEVLAAQGGGQSAGSHIPQQPQQEVAVSPCGGSSPQAPSLLGCWVPCFAVKANALALPGCSLTSFVLGYYCGLKRFP